MLENITDRHHFDNPVYQLQGSVLSRREDDAMVLLNNSKTVRNDLGIKVNNTERQMLGVAGCSDEDGKFFDSNM